MRLFRGSIRKKLVLLVLLGSVPAFLIVVVSGFGRRQDALETAEKNVNLVVRDFSEIQDKITSSTRQLLGTVAMMPDIKNKELPKCNELLSAILKANPIYSNIHLLNTKGEALASGLPFMAANFADRKQVRDALSTKEFSAGEYVIGRTLPVPTFPFAQPVLDDQGQVNGVIIIGVRLDHYGQLFRQAKFPIDSLFGIVDHSGVRLFRYPADDRTSPIGQKIAKGAFQVAQNYERGLTLQEGSDGIKRMLAFEQLRLSPEKPPYMYMFAGIRQELIYREADLLLLRDLGTLAIAVLLTMAMAWFMGGAAIGRNLEKLTLAVRRFGQGDRSVRLDIPPEDGEIGELAQAFLRMIGHLDDAVASLRASEERFRVLIEQAPEAILVYDMDEDRFVNANTNAETLFARERQELLRSSPKFYFPIRTKENTIDEEFCRQNERVLSGETLLLEQTIRNAAGQDIFCEVRLVRLPSEGGKLLRFSFIDITERKLAEDALRDSEEKFRSMVNNLNTGVFISTMEGKFLFANHSVAGMAGYGSVDEFMDISARELYADAQERARMIKMLADNGSIRNAHFRSKKRDGTIYWVSMNAIFQENRAGVPTSIIGVVEDITETKNAELEVIRLKTFYENILDNIPTGVWVTNKDDVVIFFNSAMAFIAGVSVNEVLGVKLLEDFPDEALKHFRPKYLEAKNTLKTMAYGSVPVITPSGRGTFQSGWLLPLIKDGQFDGMICTVEDITEKKLLESRLWQAQKMEAVGILAGGVAHDFNNILQAISGYTSLILMEKGPNDREYHGLKAIEKAAVRAAQLVKQLLLFSRKVETEPKRIDLNQEVDSARRILERTIPKMIEIEVDAAGRPWPVYADPVQIEQILLNLGTNAADAMPEGGKLMIKTENINLEEGFAQSQFDAKPGPYVLLSFSDTGHGMDSETVEHIFEPFFTTKEIGKGTGLGLASVYGIVKNHGGHIACYSEVGRGTTFKIYLPAMEPTDTDEKGAFPARPPRGGIETILLVDDDEPIRNFAKQALLKFGYKVLTASTGEEALEVHSARSNEIDLIIMDLGMPGMGGHKCMKEILKRDPLSRILVASGYSINGQVKKTLEAGAAGFVGKPYQINDFLEKVRAVLDRGE